MNRADIHVGVWYRVHIDGHPLIAFDYEVTSLRSGGDGVGGIIHHPNPAACAHGWHEGQQDALIFAFELMWPLGLVECIDEPPGPPGPL
jgi:hypothetical protein